MITFTRTGDWSTADIKIKFVDYGNGGLCAYGNNMQVSLNYDNSARFSYTGIGIDLHTTILHEIGHLIIYAEGHDTAGAASIMGITGCTVTEARNRRILRTLTDCDKQRVHELYDTYHTVTIENDFSGSNGGQVTIDTETLNSPVTKSWRISSFPHSLTAIDGQSIPEGEKTYIRRFNRWRKEQTDFSTNSSVQISAGDGNYKASFLKEYNITFQNSLLGSGSGGVVTVNGNQVSAPTSSFPVVQFQNITAAAIDQTIQGIIYTFNHWTDGTNNYYGYNQTFTPTDHTNLTAVFNAQPYYVTNLRSTSSVGSYVRLEWDEHPHPNVSRYDIYREVRSFPGNVLVDGPEYRGYKNRGTTSYTDIEYRTAAIGSGSYDLRYDVRPYFSLNGVSAPIRYSSFGAANPGISPESYSIKLIALPTTTDVSNYPNPFNPTTTIKYQIAEPSFVRITVYDVMGRKVSELLNEPKPAGYFDVVWDGVSENGWGASTGIYFLYFTAQVEGKKEMFSKTVKLLLSK